MVDKQCDLCHRMYSSTSIAKHRKAAHSKCLTCHQVVLASSMQTHKIACSTLTAPRCTYCHIAFSDRKAWRKHLKLPHETQRCGGRILHSDRKSHRLNCEECRECYPLLQDYLTRARNETASALQEFEQRVKSYTVSSPRSRLVEEGGLYLNILKNLVLGDPITASQYLGQ